MSDNDDKAAEAKGPAADFQADVDRQFTKLREGFKQANQRGRNAEVLLDLYANLADAADAAEKIVHGEEPQLTRDQLARVEKLRALGRHHGKIQAPIVLGARVIGQPWSADCPEGTDAEPIEGRVVHVFGRQDDPNLLVSVEYGVVQMRLRSCHFPVDPVEDADARARKVRAAHMDGMIEMMTFLREMMAVTFGMGGTVSPGGDGGRTYPFPVPDNLGRDGDGDGDGPSIRF